MLCARRTTCLWEIEEVGRSIGQYFAFLISFPEDGRSPMVGYRRLLLAFRRTASDKLTLRPLISVCMFSQSYYTNPQCCRVHDGAVAKRKRHHLLRVVRRALVPYFMELGCHTPNFGYHFAKFSPRRLANITTVS